MKLKALDHELLMALNASSVHAGRKQNLRSEHIPVPARRQYLVNFRFDHQFNGQKDVRMSVILKPGVLTAWLDVSIEEYNSIPEAELTELEWEAVVCVGTPRWVE